MKPLKFCHMRALFDQKWFWPFVFANTVAPVLMGILLDVMPRESLLNNFLFYGSIIGLLIANVMFFRRFSIYKWVVGTVIFLNTITFIAVGHISFFTSIPRLPWVISQYLKLLSQM